MGDSWCCMEGSNRKTDQLHWREMEESMGFFDPLSDRLSGRGDHNWAEVRAGRLWNARES